MIMHFNQNGFDPNRNVPQERQMQKLISSPQLSNTKAPVKDAPSDMNETVRNGNPEKDPMPAHKDKPNDSLILEIFIDWTGVQ